MNPNDARRTALGAGQKAINAIDAHELEAAINSFESAIDALEAIERREADSQ